MRDKIIEHITARFRSYADLAEQISDAELLVKLPVPKNKELRSHFWCVVGARESYTKALAAGQWSGFGCSLENCDKADIIQGLNTSADAFRRTVAGIEDWTEAREELLADLLEHEVMHEGQIIRHVYALARPLPKSFKWA
jgi:hypothetical protein